MAQRKTEDSATSTTETRSEEVSQEDLLSSAQTQRGSASTSTKAAPKPAGEEASLSSTTATALPPRCETSSSSQLEEEEEIQVTPFPMKAGLITTLCIACEAISTTLLMPFVGLYVAQLNHIPANRAGLWSGFVVSSYMIGQIISSKSWGSFSDIFGRKPALRIGLVLGSIAVIFFGLAETLWFALVSRLVQGIFNGNLATVKTVIAEITDSTNKATGFALISLGYGVGTMVGMAAGGLLYDPVRQWGIFDPKSNDALTQLLLKHPALLPALFNCLCSSLASWMCGTWFTECNPRAKALTAKAFATDFLFPFLTTGMKSSIELRKEAALKLKKKRKDGERGAHHNHQHDTAEPTAPGMQQLPSSSSSTEIAPLEGSSTTDKKTTSVDNSAVVIVADETPAEKEQNNNQDQEQQQEEGEAQKELEAKEGEDEEPQSPSHTPGTISFTECFSYPAVRHGIVEYCFMALNDIIFIECFPLLAILDQSHGGLGMSAAEIGLISTLQGFFQLLSTAVFPLLVRWFGPERVFQVSALLGGIVLALTPALHFAGESGYLFVVVATHGAFRVWTTQIAFSLALMAIAKASPPEHLGTVTGVSQTCSASTRMLTPILATPIFAWSVMGPPLKPFPFNAGLVFLIAGLCFVGAGVHSRWAMMQQQQQRRASS